MRTISIVLTTLALASTAHAETFVLNYTNTTQSDPAETFQADCLGATEAPDCAARAAALNAELVESLGELEGLSDEETVALFTSALAIDDPSVQELGLRYFSRRRNLPTGLWASVKSFFFGPDPVIGQASAEVLETSLDMNERELSERYLEQRPSGTYDPSPSEEDMLALAFARDALLDAVSAFPEPDRFANASRLLVNDNFIPSLAGDEQPVSAFVTDAPRGEVEAYFTNVMKKPPYPSPASSGMRLEVLNAELADLQTKVIKGDRNASQRLQEVIAEVTTIQEGLTVAGLLNLDDLECNDHVFWLDGPAQDAYTKPITRAVVVGTDALIGRTAIRYISGTGKSTAQPTNDGGVSVPDAGAVTGTPDAGIGPGPGPSEQPGKTKSGGCSAVPAAPSASAWLLALLLAHKLRRASPRRRA